MAHRFTYEELTDFHLAYGASYDNALATRRIYDGAPAHFGEEARDNLTELSGRGGSDVVD